MSDQIRSMPTFALVIPAYNRAHLIGETIDSALNQRTPFAEIIVVDDGSTDNTLEVLRAYGSRINVIATRNQGVQAARNTGIRAATSDYATLCDSDDLLEPDFLETCSAWLAAHPDCDVLYSNFLSFNQSTVFKDRLSYAPPGKYDDLPLQDEVLFDIPELLRRVIEFQILFPTGSTVKRAMYDVIGGYNPAFNGVGAEDFEFVLRAVARFRVAFCTRPLARIRRHDGNDSSDQLRQVQGEITIMEYALQHHTGLASARPAFDAGFDEKCAYVFDAAFARGDFALASATLEKFVKRPGGKRFMLKHAILKSPSFIRRPLWRLTQAR
jgi:glycosyltransferase involved in cell wall biosynthesis